MQKHNKNSGKSSILGGISYFRSLRVSVIFGPHKRYLETVFRKSLTSEWLVSAMLGLHRRYPDIFAVVNFVRFVHLEMPDCVLMASLTYYDGLTSRVVRAKRSRPDIDLGTEPMSGVGMVSLCCLLLL